MTIIKQVTIFFLWGALSTSWMALHGQQKLSATSLFTLNDSSESYGYYSTVIEPGQNPLPRLSLKTNVLYGLSATLNVGAEMRLKDDMSVNLSIGYNPWTFSGNKKLKHILVQPELRYWLHESFNGHFFGTHLSYINYNTGNLNLPLGIIPGLKKHRYRGNGFGLGLSYGYQYNLARRWNMEAAVGLGYVYLDYSSYQCQTCGSKLDEKSKHYLGPTKAAVSLIYILK